MDAKQFSELMKELKSIRDAISNIRVNVTSETHGENILASSECATVSDDTDHPDAGGGV